MGARRRALAVAFVAAAATTSLVAADACTFTRNGELCPSLGAPCTNSIMCMQGSYCRADLIGAGTWSGNCDNGPDMSSQVYGQTCNPASPTDCEYYNPLALTPGGAPSLLQCARPVGSTLGACRLQPNNHGDACNVNAECASGNCLTEIRLCKGIDPAQACTPGLYPDQCSANYYCAPSPGSYTGGYCLASVAPGRTCSYSTACTLGYYCTGSGAASGVRKCLAPFTVPDFMTTTIGPFMCSSANALLIGAPPNTTEPVYQCIPANSTQTLQLCDSAQPAPAGYQCTCASDNQNRLMTVQQLGLGARSQVWRDLYTCMLASTNIMGDRCQFDFGDMVNVRYGSCVYYACYPFYLRLVNVTGGRYFVPPLNTFAPYAQCEINAAMTYYANVATTRCVKIPNMENWVCASLAPPQSLSIASTTAIIAVVFLTLAGAYIGHAYYFRHKNKSKFFSFLK